MRSGSVAYVTAALMAGLSTVGSLGDTQPSTPGDMQGTPLIPRSVLFSDPDKANPKISPDGARLAYLAPVDGVMNVWVAPIGNPAAAKPVTTDRKQGIRMHYWAFDNRHVAYTQDKEGDGDWHVYVTDPETKETRDLTPYKGVQAQIQEGSYRFPNEMLIAINDRLQQFPDLYRVNIETGERKLVQHNDGYLGITTDVDLNARLVMKMTPGGGVEFLKSTGTGQDWTSFMRISQEDAATTVPMGLDKSGKILYMADGMERDVAALVAYHLETDEKRIMASDPRVGVDGVIAHPIERTVEAASFTYERSKWKAVDDSIRADLQYLEQVADGDLSIAGRTLDDKHWLVRYLMDDGPARYYHYDRVAHKAGLLFTNQKNLEGLPLAKMHPVVIKSRDGLDLVSYLSLPVWADKDGNGRPERPLPMVLSVHNGAWSRMYWGYHVTDQWLTNRGYAVLQVNTRGSGGFGKKFMDAGDKEWGRKRQEDLIDAVNWAIQQGIADPKRIALTGVSYGGYATLMGLASTPDVFACGVDICGPVSLLTLLRSIPERWGPVRDMHVARVGDHRSHEGRALLAERSPMTHKDRISKPLLIVHGAVDPRIEQTEPEEIVKTLEEKKIPVTYILFPNEGHGIARPDNRDAFLAVAEAFLAKHLGGRCEPIGKEIEGSRITVPNGADQVPGLAEALRKKTEPAPPGD